VLEFDFQSLPNRGDDNEAAIALIERARELAVSSNRAAVEFLVAAIGVRVTNTRNESYFADTLNYLQAHVFAHHNMPQQAAEAMAASHVLPGSGGDALFDEAVAESLALARAQDEAIARGAPAVVIASMPRSASAALTHTLAEIMGAPLFRVSIGSFPNYWLVPAWLRRFLRGGGILHDHFGASEFNLGVLRDCGVRRVDLLARDPRAAAASYAAFVKNVLGKISDHEIESHYSKRYIPWLQDWLSAEKRSDIAVRWIRSVDVVGGPDRLSRVLSSILGEIEPYAALIGGVELADANLVKGDPEGWRALVSLEAQERMWRLLPSEIVDRLELHP
jgi:hypothetical protein